jgi:3-hydroxyisobutyrate dehydrogenase
LPENNTMIAYLGTGLLGANFVKAMLKKGKEVQVWNRSPEKAKALESSGAKAFSEPADAVKGADTIHLTLSDDQAVDAVLEKASSGFKTGVIIIDHTTTSVSGAARRTKYWKERGFDYIHAPVFMGPPNALEATGVMMISGNQEIIKKIEPELSAMTGKLVNFGADTNKAAAMKLLGNLFLMALTAGISDTLALAKALQIPASDVEALLANWNPGNMVPARLKRILSDQFSDPSWELKMARKDARLMMEEAAEGPSLTIIPAIAKEMDRWIENGHGNDDWTIIAKDNV